MANILTYLMFYGIPASAVVFFAVSLFRYCHGKHLNKRTPETVPPEKMKSRKICLIVSSIIAGILAAVVIGFAVLLLMAVAFM